MNTKRMVYLFAGVFIIIFALVVIAVLISRPKTEGTISQEQPVSISEIDESGYSISVAELQDAQDGWIVIDDLESQTEGWLAIYSDNDGELGQVLGYVEMELGSTGEIAIPIQPERATQIMYAAMHSDDGQYGVFEPNLDSILVINDSEMVVSFKVTLSGPVSDIFIEDQMLMEGAEIAVSEVSAPDAPVWLAIHNDNNGQPGEVIGFTLVEEEVIEYITVTLDETKLTSTLYASLNLDLGKEGNFEPDSTDRIIYLYGDSQYREFQILDTES